MGRAQFSTEISFTSTTGLINASSGWSLLRNGFIKQAAKQDADYLIRFTIMPSGTVKWFNPEKGFGFIIPDEGGRDIFVHRSNVSGLDFGEALEEGQRVVYDTEETPKGIQAVDVEIEA